MSQITIKTNSTVEGTTCTIDGIEQNYNNIIINAKNGFVAAFHDNMIGQVFKVHGRNGHEGRAAKIVDIHLDKGIA